MHALQSLYRCLRSRCPEIHQKRLTSLCAAAMAAVSGSALSVSDLGRGMMGRVSAKHNIKRIDRLLSNRALHAELPTIYQALCRQALDGMPYPLIIVDWSDLMTDRTWQLLRASVAVQGRSVTLYEEIHPMAKLGAREVHAAFLAALAKTLPMGCIPVILTDAGFRSTWFELVDRMGWMWIGRVRNRDMVKPLDGDSWEGCKTLYDRATTTAQSLGLYDYVRSNPVTCRLVLLKHSVKGRRQCCLDGKRTRSKLSLQHARSQSEPWLLALCPKLAALNAESVIATYAQRMQIEEAFRDLKNERLGMGLAASRSKKQERIRVLLLIGALAEFVLRSLGQAARTQQLDRQYQSNTRRSRPVLSIISLGRQLARKTLSVLGDGEFSTLFQRLRDGCMAFI